MEKELKNAAEGNLVKLGHRGKNWELSMSQKLLVKKK